MTFHESVQTENRKQALRAHARAQREGLTDREQRSREIAARFLALREYRAAETILLYVSVASEVGTRPLFEKAWADGKRVAVPYCVHGSLALFHLEAWSELEAGRYNIPEPRRSLRSLEEKWIQAEQLDLVVTPGVAFDRRGGRLGQGKGYYDELLPRLRDDASRVALAFECQMVGEIPRETHDMRVGLVITEQTVYDARRA